MKVDIILLRNAGVFLMYKILLYEDNRGNCPISDFIAELDSRALTDKYARNLLKKFYYSVELLKKNGTRCGEKFTKQIDGKLWELRPDDHRVFFFLWEGNHIVLLHSFLKTTKKTPILEINKAKQEMQSWIDRYGK